MIKQNKKDYKLANAALVFLVIYITIMIGVSLIPGADLQNTVIPTYSGVLHFLEFIGLALIGVIVFTLYDIEYFLSSLTGLVVFMSGLTEGIQYFVPGRFFGMADFVVNIAGGLTIILIILISNLLFLRKERPI